MARILLLEDDPDQRELRKLLLENAGHHVDTAVSADDAMSAAADSDVIVLDLVPGIEELLSRLAGTARVIVLSGRQSISEQIAARSACVLRKPCSSRKLIEAIARVC